MQEQLKHQARLCSSLISWHDAISKICDGEDFVEIDFHLVPALVASRSFPIKGGKVCISKSNFKRLEFCAFLYFLWEALKNPNLEQDSRTEDIARDIIEIYEKTVRKSDENRVVDNLLSAENVEAASENFPPCFSNLHQKLVKEKRLKHSARFAYSLFLKVIYYQSC